MEETEQIEGKLSRVIFKNDNGFVIGQFTDPHNNRFTALGSLVNPQVDVDYLMSGYWTEDHRFGEQFKFHSYETLLPVDSNGIFKYIVRICKFVGSTVGQRIVDRYKDQTLIVMKSKPEQLSAEIPGITLDRAFEIQATLQENEENETVLVELETLLDVPGLRKNLAGDLIKDFKKEAAEQVRANPYILTSFPGVGFLLADRVAMNVGYARNGIERKKAATLHCMQQNMQEGSIWISKKNLIETLQALIQVPDLADGLDALLAMGTIVSVENLLALARPAADEQYIASFLADLANEEVAT